MTMNRYEAESIDEDLVLADRETATNELRRLRQQNKMLGRAAREANERLVKVQAALEDAEQFMRIFEGMDGVTGTLRQRIEAVVTHYVNQPGRHYKQVVEQRKGRKK